MARMLISATFLRKKNYKKLKMNKIKLIILLLFVCVFMNAQPPISPDNGYWNGTIRVSDSALMSTNNDSIGHAFLVDYDITLGYIPTRTHSGIAINGDTIYPTCVNAFNVNYNRDSLLYLKITDQTFYIHMVQRQYIVDDLT